MTNRKPHRVRLATPWYVWALALAFLAVLVGSFLSPAVGRTIRDTIGTLSDRFAN